MTMQWSTQKAKHGKSMLSTPGQFRPVLSPQVSKNDEEHYFLK